MSKIIKGDITSIKKGIIVHQVNCQNAMGSGVAKALYTKYPQVKNEFHKLATKQGLLYPTDRLGVLQEVKVNDDLSIYNSFSQLNYGTIGKHTNEPLLVNNICKVAETNKDKEVYIPYLIGCGLGGGDWKTIYNGIKHIENLTIVRL